MTIYELTNSAITALKPTTFLSAGIMEREDLQRCLRDNIEVIAPDTLVIAEEFKGWENSSRRIDLLAIDKDANLVVIELKRTEDGGHMDLQAVRYAAMVSQMTFDQAVNVFDKHRQHLGKPDQQAKDIILQFLNWSEPNEAFARDDSRPPRACL